MVSVDDEAMAQEAENLLRMRSERVSLEKRISACEKSLRKGLSERHTISSIFGKNVVSIVKFASQRIPDVERMRMDGVFDKYSKLRVESERLKVVPVEKMNGKPVPNDGIPF